MLAQSQGLASEDFTVTAVFHGGMGVCARVESKASPACYALKAILRDLAEDSAAWVRFVEEMKVWLTLSSCDGVVEAYRIDRVNELPCISASWMTGGDLRRLMKRRNRQLFYASLYRLARTLEWAYSNHGIVHRDMKPENVLLDSEDSTYVSDWGLARPLVREAQPIHSPIRTQDRTYRPDLTQAGQFIGTISYASPEQILGLEHIDHRSDMYSLGCIMFEWESGHLPFLGSTPGEVAHQHLCQPAPALVRRFRRTVFGVERIIARCLEKDPSKRFPDWDSFAKALLDVARQRRVQFTPYVPGIRYAMPAVGRGEFLQRLRSGDLGAGQSRNGSYALIELDELEPHLLEAEALAGLGDWRKAHDIYASVFVPELVRSAPDFPPSQSAATGYAACLIKLGRAAEAVPVLQCLSEASQVPAEYFVNLSLAHLHLQDPHEAEQVARAGLATYPGDRDILGNLLIAQTSQRKCAEALATAQRRLELSRDVHSLEEAADVLICVGEEKAECDWPAAVGHYREAAHLLCEAKELNPRFATARYNLAKVLFNLEQYSQSIEQLLELRSIPVHPVLAERCSVLEAMCLHRVGAHKQCVQFCDRSSHTKENTELQRLRAQAIIDGFCIGKEDDGVRTVERSSLDFFAEAVKDPAKSRASDFCYLARMREWMGKAEEAKDVLRTAKARYPDYWEIPFHMGAFHWRCGDLDDALSSASVAVELAPWRPQAWTLLSHVNRALGREQDAVRALEQARVIEEKREGLASWR